MSMSDHKAKDAAMASYMKQHPHSFPDSVMRPWHGNGADLRALGSTMGRVFTPSSTNDFGMLGGILCARLGLGDANIPADLL